MKLKRIEFAHEVRDCTSDLDVFVENEDSYVYTMVVCTPDSFVNEMKDEKVNFVKPSILVIIVKKLTEPIVKEAIEACAKK